MKRYILFLAFLVAGFTASAQQNINDSLKNEELFGLLVKTKGRLLQELDAVRKTDDQDTLNQHFDYIICLCYTAGKAIKSPKAYTPQLEMALLIPHRGSCEVRFVNDNINDTDPLKLYEAMQLLGGEANGYKYVDDLLVIRKAVLSVEPRLRKAIITY